MRDIILENHDMHCISKDSIDNLFDIVLVMNEDGKILYGNKKAVETYGYTYDELTNLSVFDLRNQDIKEFTKKQLGEALKKGIVFKTFHYKKDGTKFPVEVRSIYSSEGSKDRVISTVRDMSDIDKVFNEALMFSTSLSIFDDAIVVLSKDFEITIWSSGAERKLGYKNEEILGKSVDILIPKDLIDEYDNKINSVKDGCIVENYETVRIHKNGYPIDVSISISPLYDTDGIFNGAIGIYKDISERRRLIEIAHECEERWRFALEGGKLGVWDWNISNNYMLCSALYNETLGYEEGEIGNTFEDIINLIHPEDVSYVRDKINKHFNGDEYIVEFRMKCKNEEYKWIRSKARISKWTEDGKPLRMVGIHEDITDRKLLEEEIDRKYRQLELLKEEAEHTNKAKSQFLANMSHEIRTPLNGVIATIQLLQTTNLTSEQTKYVKMSRESIDTLITVINDILDMSKLESGNSRLNNEPFNLKNTVNCIYDNLLITGTSKGLEVSYYLDPNIDFEVIGDEIKLKQILTNLISNAVKFTNEGYVSFRVKMISSDNCSEKIEFRVKDSGIGIEEIYKQKIFQNFSQGDISTKKKYMGTGLGLAISKQLATLMGGDISFDSIEGEGSTFCFSCDFIKSNKTNNTGIVNDVPEQTLQHDEIKRDKVILCIEDNLINQEVMESIILKGGYTYIAAYDGEEAFEKLKNNKVDLILMDIQLPKMNGYEITKMIRNSNENIKTIPIIAMTAYAMREDREKSIETGMNNYISKPFDIENLYSILELYIGK